MMKCLFLREDLKNSPGEKLAEKLGVQVGKQARAQLYDQVFYQEFNQVFDQVHDQITDQIPWRVLVKELRDLELIKLLEYRRNNRSNHGRK